MKAVKRDLLKATPKRQKEFMYAVNGIGILALK